MKCTEITNGLYNVVDSFSVVPKFFGNGYMRTFSSGISLVLYVTVLIYTIVNYADYETKEKNSFILTRCLNAIAGVFAGLGGLTYVVELMYGEEEKPPALETVRNFVSTGATVLVALLLGEYTKDSSYFGEFLGLLIALIFVRVIIDVGLDDAKNNTLIRRLGMKFSNYTMEQLEAYSEKENLEKKYARDIKAMEQKAKEAKQILVGLCFTIVIVLTAVYMGDETRFDIETASHNDGLLITVLVLVSFHLLLIIWGYLYSVCKRGCNTDTMSTINEIPWVSKAVFTANLVCLSCTIGERIAVDQRVVELVASLVLLGMAEAVARNEI